MKTKLMGAVLAVFLGGCGTEESPSDEFCGDVQQAVDSVRSGLGSCTANYKNEEPLAFSRAACDAELATTCSSADLEEAQEYVACLRAVAPCVAAQQAAFDEAIDACLDSFQESDADAVCIELVVGD